MTGQMIEKIEEVALKENPDWIMVYGDTNSTLAGAIVASKLHIKLAHIEAGLRSFNMKMPEEVNRILTDRVSQILFCPTSTAITNLENEGFGKFNVKIINSGDVMLDGATFYKNLAIKPTFDIDKDYILCTIHRAENTDNKQRLVDIFEALNVIAKDKQIILPLHPRTSKIIKTLDININNLTIIDPVGYLEMVWLIDNCSLVMTDSGGLQKEAYFFKKQCITLRDETEWVELCDIGVNTLVGADKIKILDAYKNNSTFNSKNSKLNLYGTGKASENIILDIIHYERG
jgi:UDP-GlcNAc3NAcA epimerase